MPNYRYFVLLGLKTGPVLGAKYPEGFVSWPHTFSESDDVSYRLVLTKEQERAGSEADKYLSHGMILISTKKDVELGEGLHYGHAIEALLPITYFCVAKIYDEFSMLPLRQESYERLARPWKFAEILDECRVEILDLYGDVSHFAHSYHSYTVESLSWVEHAIPYLKGYAVNNDFQRGCSYLFLSMWELGVDACDWREEEYDPEFYRFVSISKAESAFLNAFKAVEAIVGEPSKDRTRHKLAQRLRERKIDPQESVGYRVKEKLIDKIVKFHSLRDQIAAHGIGRTKKTLRLSEIIDLQSLARHLLLSSSK